MRNTESSYSEARVIKNTESVIRNTESSYSEARVIIVKYGHKCEGRPEILRRLFQKTDDGGVDDSGEALLNGTP